MKQKFKDFYKTKVPQTDITNKKIEIVLFAGDYTPITIRDTNRVEDFYNEVVKENPDNYSEDLEIAFLVNHTEDDIEELKYSNRLTIQDINFINSTFFGLKTYGLPFNDFYESTYSEDINTVDIKENIKTFFDEKFRGKNVEIVFNDSKKSMFKKINDIISIETLNFRFFSDTVYSFPHVKFSDIYITSDILKAICLLDYEKPDPENISIFCSRYELDDLYEDIKTLHHMSQNRNYHLLFSMVFPKINLNNTDSENEETNNKIVMKLIQQLYLKNEV